MKSTIENTGGLARKISVELPQDRVASALDRVYKQIQKKANIKGFRQGKAPMSMIKTMYADRVQNDVIQDLVAEGYSSALSEHKLTPISQPNVQIEKFDENANFSFTAEIEVRPEIKIKNYEKLKVEKEILAVDASRVDTILENLRKQKLEHVPVFEDRSAIKGDVAELDFSGDIDGTPLEGGQAKNYKLELGSNSFIPGFEDGLLGMKPGQSKDIHLTFPADYGNAEIAGKNVKFAVTLHKLFKTQLPALNDEFAKTLGGVESLQALKDQITEDLKREEEGRINSDLKSNLLKALVKVNPGEVPKSLLENQRAALVKDVEKRLAGQGATPADIQEYQSKWGSDLDETASFMIQSSFLVDHLSEELKLAPTDKEFQERIASYSVSTGIELEKLKSYYKDDKRRNQLEYQMVEEKVVAKLIELADIKEVPADKLKKN